MARVPENSPPRKKVSRGTRKGKQKESHRASGKTGAGQRKAGLLWLLLGAERRTIATRLSSDELLELAEGGKAYKTSSSHDKAKTLNTVRRVLANERERSWPAALSAGLFVLAAALFVAHAVLHPEQSFLFLLSLFGPLLIGCISPLTLYLLPAYRRVGLFSPSGFLYAPPAFVALLWLLFLINTSTDIPIGRLPFFELSILSLGALLAPLLEEIFFRELLPGSVGRSPHFAGHLGAAVLFAVLHLPVDGSQFVYYLMAAATLSLLRILSGNLLWPIAVHSAANIASLWIMQ